MNRDKLFLTTETENEDPLQYHHSVTTNLSTNGHLLLTHTDHQLSNGYSGKYRHRKANQFSPNTKPNRSIGRKLTEMLNSRATVWLLKIILTFCVLVATGILVLSSLVLHPQWAAEFQTAKIALPQRYVVETDTVVPSTIIYVITPTAKKRNAQKADLTRLSQTLKLVPNLHWVVVEDSTSESKILEVLLKRSKLNYTHLHTPLDPKLAKGRGMTQRNLGVQWVKDQYRNVSLHNIDAVVYFGDDDNSYDVRLFNEYIRKVQRVGAWPIAFTGSSHVESPVVENGTIVGWNVSWAQKRDFALDMGAFAINLREFMKYNDARFNEKCKLSYYEPCLLRQFKIKKEELEPFGFDQPEGEREVYVWHTKTQQNHIKLKGGDKGFII